MLNLERAVKDNQCITKYLTREIEGQERLQELLKDLPEYSSEGDALHIEIKE